ncbi:AAA domain-containing protein [Kiloniella antarctica]|uniref:Phospholipase D n=1 Tax=Kiloniella antarctica TaxID=1550907 RepID=A0ABW5BLH2_9PROT
MADSLLKGLGDKAALHEIKWQDIRAGKIDPIFAKKLIIDFSKAFPNQIRDGQEDTAPVLIAPLTFIPLHNNGYSSRSANTPYAPIIIPATVSKSGTISPNSKSIPWVVREALEPSEAKIPSIGLLSDFDKFRSTNLKPRENTWEELLNYTEKMCQSILGMAIEAAETDEFSRGPSVIQAGNIPFSASTHIIKLTDYLIKNDQSFGALSGLFQTTNRKPTLLPKDQLFHSQQHIGQMEGHYPLSAMQRESLHHLTSCKEGDLLAVNGPPGTGKTALIQSVIANLFVNSALEETDPPIIFAVSSNNQAVTNIIDSFGIGSNMQTSGISKLKSRWIPNLYSYGLYLPSKDKKVDNNKYQTAYMPNFGKPISGFPATLLNDESLDQAEIFFLEQARITFAKDVIESVEDVRGILNHQLKSCVEEIRNVLKAAIQVCAFREKYNGSTLFSVQNSLEKKQDELNELQKFEHNKLKDKLLIINQHKETISKFENLCDQALSELVPTGFFEILFNWIPVIKGKKWDRCRDVFKKGGFKQGIVNLLVIPKINDVRDFLNNHLTELTKHLSQLEEEYKVEESASETYVKTKQIHLSEKIGHAKAWRHAEEDWNIRTEALIQSSAKDHPSILNYSLEDLQKSPHLCNHFLDISFRHKAFLLATHYWEARWLIEARNLFQNAKDPLKKLSGKSKEQTEERFKLLASLTPCFVSTLYMLPQHLTFYNPKSDEFQNSPLINFADLLIIDEAGQVLPEIGGPVLALGKKALIVGDIHQIEPIRNIEKSVDHGNIKRCNLEPYEAELNESGLLAKNGSLMKIARKFSAYKREDEEGMFLSEHRRCQTEIISVSNDLIYDGRLIPKTPPLKNPLFPTLGWANIRSSSRIKGGSKYNPGEAGEILDWLGRHQREIEQHYNKPIQEIVGIITPYGAQKWELKKALQKSALPKSLTVGTVHALQGAERNIIIFSPTSSLEDEKSPFFDLAPNMLNVAISRAKDSFLTFGDMRLFDSTQKNKPSSILAKHLFRSACGEIFDVSSRPVFQALESGSNTRRLETLKDHQNVLDEALQTARKEVLIISPYIREFAIRKDNITSMIGRALTRGVKVTVAYDLGEHKKKEALNGINLVKETQCEIFPVRRVHNKTLVVDNKWIVEGSFNWLSAVRDLNNQYSNQERSLRYEGPKAHEYCLEAWNEVAKHKYTPQNK